MLKLIFIGVWVILITAGATYGSVYLANSNAHVESTDEPDMGVEELKSEMTSIPIMRNGDITGYLILQFSFAADRGLLSSQKFDPMPFLMDAVFRVIFTKANVDFQRLRSKDLEEITAAVALEANSRMGFELVRHVLLQQVNFVRREDIRTNWIKNSDNQN